MKKTAPSLTKQILRSCILTSLALSIFLFTLVYFEGGSNKIAAKVRQHDFFLTGDGSLEGAVEQNPPKSPPGPYEIDDPQQVPLPEKEHEQKQNPPTPPASETKGGVRIWNHQKINTFDGDKVDAQIAAEHKPVVKFTVKDDIKYDPAGPKPSQIVILTASDGKGHNGGIPNILEKAEENRKEYADHHGYIYKFVNISKYKLHTAIHPVWKKLPAIAEAFEENPDAQWVFWLDLDAIVMSPGFDLSKDLLSHEALKQKLQWGMEYHTSERKPCGVYMSDDKNVKDIDLIISQDQNGVNAGSFLIRRSKYTQMLMDFWMDSVFIGKNWIQKEQATLEHLILTHPIVREHTGLIRQPAINAYPLDNVPDMGWEKGDLLVHLAGCWVRNICESQWKSYWDRRVTVKQLKEEENERQAILQSTPEKTESEQITSQQQQQQQQQQPNQLQPVPVKHGQP